MEAFLISCTTCQVRLRVRQPELTGQILPCPKCGGMVMVEPIARDDGSAPTASGSLSTDSAVPRSDSFEHIEQLLEGKMTPSSPTPKSRWRVPVAEGSDTTTEPVSSPDTLLADATSDDEIDSSGGSFHRVALIGMGIIAGGVLAVAVAGWMLSRPSQTTTSANPLPTEIPDQKSEERAFEKLQEDERLQEDGRQRDTAPALVPDVEQQPPTSEFQEEESSSGDEASSLIATGPASDGSPPVPPTVAGETPEVSNGDERGDASEAAVNVPSTNEFAAGDELADFARWLQDVKPETARDPADSPKGSEPDSRDSSDPLEGDEPVVEILPSRTPPPPVNAETRLAAKVSALKMDDVPMIEALRAVSSISGVPISVDPNSLGRRNRPTDFPVKARVENASIQEVLKRMLKGTGLTFVVQQGQVRITTIPESRQEYVVAKHRIGDLTDGQPETAGQLSEWVRALFEPNSWVERGGEADCRVNGETFVISHRDTTQYRILVFFEQLRVARGLPPRTSMLEQRIRLDRRPAALDESVTLRLWQEVNLDDIAAEIEGQVSLRILVDWQALYEAGWTPQDRYMFLGVDQPLHAVLDDLLTPMGLTYHNVDAQTIEITSPAIIAAKPAVEVYRLTDTSRSVDDVRELSRRIADHVGKQRFAPNGEGAIFYDSVSQSIVISLPKGKQQDVLQWLRDAGQLR